MMSLDFFSVSCLQNRKRRLYRMSCRCHFWYGIEENPGGKVLSMEKCAIFFRLSGSLHAAAFDVSVTAWEGRRKPTGKSLFEISQKWSIRVLRPFSVCFPVFSAGKLKTSDFFDTKFRCLSLKVRMFCLEKSGVFGVKIAWFTPYLRNFMPTFPP